MPNFLHNYIIVSAQDIIGGSVNNNTSKLVKDYQLQIASFVREIVLFI